MSTSSVGPQPGPARPGPVLRRLGFLQFQLTLGPGSAQIGPGPCAVLDSRGLARFGFLRRSLVRASSVADRGANMLAWAAGLLDTGPRIWP